SLHPHEKTIVDVIAKLGLELQVIFNKGAVMVLPTGVNKATGLIAALQELKLSAHNVVGIGDAENDLSFLSLCECSVAFATAIPLLKEQADYTMKAENGDGVIELTGQEFWLVVDKGFQPMGLVMGNCIYSMGAVKNWLVGIKSGFQGELKEYSQLMYQARELALSRLQFEADQLGADGVIGVDIK